MIRRNVTAEAFAKAFPSAEQREEWITKVRYNDYDGRPRVEYSSLPLRKKHRIEMDLTYTRAHDKLAGWIYDEERGELSAFFLDTLVEQEIPNEYAKLIQYVDCMIDTTAQIYRVQRATDEEQQLPPDSKILMFLNWAKRYEGEPKEPDIDWNSPYAEEQSAKYYREVQQWNNKRIAALDEKMKKDQFHKSLLMEATEEAISNNMGDEELEFYVERYLSPKEALEMKRNRKPMGACSMDRRPRQHAANICRLAAETSQWDIFLRAHLDIMNDRFDRMTDGSYAWAARGTYLKELEELDIDAQDLLIGTCLRSANTNKNHYFGDIGRIGRALSETSRPDTLVARLTSMIKDERLDLFNRLLTCYLFDNFNYYLTDENVKEENARKLIAASESLPFGIGEIFRRTN